MRKVNYALILIFYSFISFAQIAYTDAKVHADNPVEKDIELAPIKYLIKYLDINTNQPDYAVTYHNDKVVFKKPNVKKLSKNKNIYEQSNLFVGEMGEEGVILNATETTGISTRKITKTGAAFTADGKTVYFSAKKYRKRPRRKDKEQLFKAHIDDKGNWINIVELPITGKHFSSGEPSLNADETKLYFTSDRPGTVGATDIFYVDINADGTLGTPKNLGKNINTSGYEVTPYITKDNLLYFSSDGRSGGKGNLDVYKVDLNNPNAAPELLDAPVNGPNDDFAFIINEVGDKGYFSSNRLQGGNNYDIYSLVIENNTPKKCTQLIAGVVKDKDTDEILENADITLLDRDNNEITALKTDANGAYEITLECNQTYTLVATGNHYNVEEHIVNTANYLDAPDLEANKFLVKNTEEQAVAKADDDNDMHEEASEETAMVTDEENNETEIARAVDTSEEAFDDEETAEAVYFGFDEYNINYDAAHELDKIAHILKQNRNVHLEVVGYTDARGDAAYNQVLSEKRAKAAIDYLVAKGINAGRLTHKGYGESKMTNKCVDGISCSEAAHAKNRRTEFNFINPQAALNRDFKPKKKTISITQTNQPKSANHDKESSKEDSFSQKQIGEVEGELTNQEILEEEIIDNNALTKDKNNTELIEETEEKIETEISHNQNEIDHNINERLTKPATEITSYPDEKINPKSTDTKTIENPEKPNTALSQNTIPLNQNTGKAALANVGTEIPINVAIAKKEVVENDKAKKEILNNEDIQPEIIRNLDRPNPEKLLADANAGRKDGLLTNPDRQNIVKTDNKILTNIPGESTEEPVSEQEKNVSVEHALDNLISGRKPDMPTEEELAKKAEEEKLAEANKPKKKPKKVANPIPINSMSVTPMQNKRGKFIENDKANKIHALRLTFKIIPNPKAKKGYKDAYVVIKSPNGKIISQKGAFTLSTGKEEFYTDATNIYYMHQPMKVVMFIEKIIHKFAKGTYDASVFIEGVKVGRTKFTVQG